MPFYKEKLATATKNLVGSASDLKSPAMVKFTVAIAAGLLLIGSVLLGNRETNTQRPKRNKKGEATVSLQLLKSSQGLAAAVKSQLDVGIHPGRGKPANIASPAIFPAMTGSCESSKRVDPVEPMLATTG